MKRRKIAISFLLIIIASYNISFENTSIADTKSINETQKFWKKDKISLMIDEIEDNLWIQHKKEIVEKDSQSIHNNKERKNHNSNSDENKNIENGNDKKNNNIENNKQYSFDNKNDNKRKNEKNELLEKWNENITENTDKIETYAGMVGDKRKSNGMLLDITMESRGTGMWLFVLNGKKVADNKLLNVYLQQTPCRLIIDVNTNLLNDKVVDFTYQMPRELRLQYGKQTKGYRIAIDLPNETKIVNKKTSKDEIAIKLLNNTLIEESKKDFINNAIIYPDSVINNKTTYIENYEGLQRLSKNASFKRIMANHKKPYIITIDAGHGGIDPGATSNDGIFEKTITLLYAKTLQKYLMKNGFKVIMTREGDATMPLSKRVKIAQKAKTDLFISLHIDAHDNPKTNGTTVYRLSHIDENHPDWQKFYNRDYLPMQYEKYIYNRNILDILVRLTHQSILEKSSIIVDNILLEFKKYNICANCRHGQRSFAVLRGLDFPSVLIEIGYITNKEELKKILTLKNVDLFCKKLADVISKTFVS